MWQNFRWTIENNHHAGKARLKNLALGNTTAIWPLFRLAGLELPQQTKSVFLLLPDAKAPTAEPAKGLLSLADLVEKNVPAGSGLPALEDRPQTAQAVSASPAQKSPAAPKTTEQKATLEKGADGRYRLRTGGPLAAQAKERTDKTAEPVTPGSALPASTASKRTAQTAQAVLADSSPASTAEPVAAGRQPEFARRTLLAEFEASGRGEVAQEIPDCTACQQTGAVDAGPESKPAEPKSPAHSEADSAASKAATEIFGSEAESPADCPDLELAGASPLSPGELPDLEELGDRPAQAATHPEQPEGRRPSVSQKRSSPLAVLTPAQRRIRTLRRYSSS